MNIPELEETFTTSKNTRIHVIVSYDDDEIDILKAEAIAESADGMVYRAFISGNDRMDDPETLRDTVLNNLEERIETYRRISKKLE